MTCSYRPCAWLMAIETQGVSGYGTVRDAVGPNSNADNPAFQPVLYNPAAPHGLRFSTSGIPASTIPRMYHS